MYNKTIGQDKNKCEKITKITFNYKYLICLN